MVDSWNDEEPRDEEHQHDVVHDNVPELPIQEGQDRSPEAPPGLVRSASIAGSATTVIVSALEVPLFKGSKLFRVNGVMRYVMLLKLKLLLILRLLNPLPEVNNFLIL